MPYEEYAQSKNETRKHKQEVNFFIHDVIKELLDRADLHDNSKLDNIEAAYFDKMTPLLENSTYGSEEYKGFLLELKPALDHHYEYNDHHPEHFGNGIEGMNLIQLIEMLCDWKAATTRHKNGDIINSIVINQKRFGYSDEIAKMLLETVFYMGWESKQKYD